MATTTATTATKTWTFTVTYDSFNDEYTVTSASDKAKCVKVTHAILEKVNQPLAEKLSNVLGTVRLDEHECRILRDASKVVVASTLPSQPTLTITPPNGKTTVVVPVVAPVVTMILPVAGPVMVNSNKVNDAEIVEKMSAHSPMGSVNVSRVEEYKVRSMQKVLSKLEGQDIYILNYYIPKELSLASVDEETGVETPIRIGSPCAAFYPLGIHLDGSNWMMTKEAIDSEEVQSFITLVRQYHDFEGQAGQGGARVWPRLQHPSETTSLIEQAMERLRNHLVSLHTSLIDNILTADSTLKDAQTKWETELADAGKVTTDAERARAVAKRNDRVRNELKRAGEALNDALSLADKYDATECVEDLFSALRHAIRSNAASFNASVEGQFTLKGRPVKGTTVAV